MHFSDRLTLDTWTPLKKKTSNQKYLTSWYNLQSCKSKQATKTDLHLALKKSLFLYKKACKGRTPYYSLLTEKKRSTPDFMSALQPDRQRLRASLNILTSNKLMNSLTKKCNNYLRNYSAALVLLTFISTLFLQGCYK